VARPVGRLEQGAPELVAVRPEALHLGCSSGATENLCRAEVTSRIYLGDHQRLLADIGEGHTITVKVPAHIDVAAGASIDLSWRTVDCRAFPASAATERALQQAGLE
jgi:putative spermidine/putrescine transport system ATP-binding protein